MRPCRVRHPVPVPEQCLFCRKFTTVEKYQKAWAPRPIASPHPMPSLAQRAVSYAKSTAQHVAAGCPTTDPTELDRRLSICQQCPGEYFDGTHCRACGCGVKDKAVRALEKCPRRFWEYAHQDLAPEKPVEWVKELLRFPPGPCPNGWDDWPNVVQAFRELFAEVAERVPSPPTFPLPRGVVICAGGWKFFPSLYVAVRVLRHVGCQLPVEVWYMGAEEFDPRMERALAPYGVSWVDGQEVWQKRRGVKIRRNRIDHGWMLKPIAAAYCSFREVLSLDADCYPVYDPTRFLDDPRYQSVGAAFWPDHNPLHEHQFTRLGLEPVANVSFESGQFAFDKARHWKGIWLTCFLNAYHELVWGPGNRHLYGDKDTFAMAWARAGLPYVMPTRRPRYRAVAYLQRDFQRRKLFIHRCQDKFRWPPDWLVDGQPAANHYGTGQIAGHNVFVKRLPHEKFCHEMLRESYRAATEGR